MDQLLTHTPLWILLVGLFLALLASREVGDQVARLVAPRDVDAADSERGYIVSGVLGLLALLIAFTFGLALDRYETRRDLVVTEANAIGTAEMRAHLLDAPYDERLSGLLRQYAETRLRYGEAGFADKPRFQQESADLRRRLQAETLAALKPIHASALAVQIAGAVNETIDIGATREAAHGARIPTAVIAVLMVYAVVSAGVMGAALKGARNSHRYMTALMFLLLTLALGLILDLDRPQTGAIIVSQEPMAALVRSLRAAPPPAASPPSPFAGAAEAGGGPSPP